MDGAQVVVDAFRPVSGEVDAPLPVVEGAVPAELRGVLYRNGPGRLEVHGTPQMHPFDGDGMVCRFEFGAGGVSYRNRYVRTREFQAESAAGRMLYRNFGTNVPGGLWTNGLNTRFKNAANTSVIRHGGKLLALWEAGLPHRLDPTTLQTLARDDYGGVLQNRRGLPSRLIASELPFSAHPKVCPDTGEMFNFGLQMGPRSELLLYRIDRTGQLRDVARVPVGRASFMHDFAITASHVVFFATPIHFDLFRALTGLSTPVEAIRRNRSHPTQILVVPRSFRGDPARRQPRSAPVQRFEAPSGFFLFHYFNAHEDDGLIHVDGCRMENFEGGTVDLRDPEAVRAVPFDPAYPTRWTLDPRNSTVTETRLSETPMELPFVDRRKVGQRQRYGFGTVRSDRAGTPLHTALGRIDFDTGRVTVREFAPDLPGEIVFVPRSDEADEADGWAITLVYRAESHTSELCILDATTLETRACLALPHHVPPGFHGFFDAN